jgi:hypothetical protein
MKTTFVILALVHLVLWLMYLVLVLNIPIEHNYFKSPAIWGVLYSCQYNSTGWWTMVLSNLRVFVAPAIATLLLFVRKRGCVLGWTVVLCILFTFDVLVFVGLSGQLAECNTPGSKCNICTDPLICCVPEYAAVMIECDSSMCKTADGSPLLKTPSQLVPQETFLWLWGANAFFLFFMDSIMGFLHFTIFFDLLRKRQTKPHSSPPTSPVTPLKQELPRQQSSRLRAPIGKGD